MGQKGFDAQQRWWAKNGKSFNVLGLAQELRDQIYGHLFPTRLYQIQFHDGNHTFGQGSEMYDHTRSGRMKELPRARSHPRRRGKARACDLAH